MDWRFVSVLLLTFLPFVLSSGEFKHNVARRPECQQLPDAGRCRAAFQRYYWNVDQQKCLSFMYGGCAGNENNFETRKECERTCRPVDPTTSPAHTESPTSEKVPVTTQRQTTWRYRKWKTCYPAKSGPKCGPKSGQQKRRRVCVFVDTNERTKPANCEGEQILLRPCVHKKCAIDGGFSDWGNWTACSATCGKAKQMRKRACDNPQPKHGGQPCVGHSSQKRKCKLPACPSKKGKTICWRRPCRNGGTCIAELSGFRCACPSTHAGPVCQFRRL